jgi:hypothetical protein
MEDLVERMKARPRHERERYAFGISAGLTALMFLVWAVSAVPRSSTMIAVAEAPRQEAASGPSPLSVLKEGVSQVAAAAQALFAESAADVSIDLDAEYERIKAEVESGSIDIIAPQEPAPRP